MAEIEQVVILLLGTSLGLVPVVEALSWLHDELGLTLIAPGNHDRTADMTDASTDRPATALVVGAGSGIGRAVAELFASRGIRTVAADLDPGAREGARVPAREHRHPRRRRLGRDRPGLPATGFSTRRSQPSGRSTASCRPSGWTAITRFLEETPDYWRRIIDVNLMSAIYVSASAGRVMKDNGGGSIVLTSSEAGVVGSPARRCTPRPRRAL